MASSTLKPSVNFSLPQAHNNWRLTAQSGLFNKLCAVLLILTLVLAVVVRLTELPPLTKAEQKALPPQLTKLVERIKLEEKPKPKPIEPELPKPEEKPKPKPEPKKLEKKPAPQTKVENKQQVALEQAKDQAKRAGLMAMADDLAAMRDTLEKPSLANSQLNQNSANATLSQRETIAKKTVQQSGGLANAQVNQAQSKQVAMASRELTALGEKVSTQAITAASKDKVLATGSSSGSGQANLEHIRQVLDQNKGAIYSMYRRALRADPTLAGKVTVKLAVSGQGQVTACDVVASELQDADLLQKLVARIKLIQFGSQVGQATTLTYSFNFLPY